MAIAASFNSNQPRKLYHVKSHGVTIDLSDNFPAMFTLYQETIRRTGSENCELVTINDKRTPEQMFPANAKKDAKKDAKSPVKSPAKGTH